MGDFEKLLEAVWEVPHTPQTFYLGSRTPKHSSSKSAVKPKTGEKYCHDDDQMTSRMVILLCFCSFPLKFAKRHELRNDQRSHAKSRFRSGIRSVVFSYTFQLALDQKPGSNSQI